MSKEEQPEEDPQQKQAMDWRVKLALSADVLTSTDPLPQLIQMLMDIQGLHRFREPIYTVLAELFSNALDHGVLRLDSSQKQTPDGFLQYYAERERRLQNLTEGCVDIEMHHQKSDEGGVLRIEVKDSGEGFDHSEINASLEGNLGFCGRGIPLIRSLCESLQYSEQGTKATAIYRWQ